MIQLVTIGNCFPEIPQERMVRVEPELVHEWNVGPGYNYEIADKWFPEMALGYIWAVKFEWLDGLFEWDYEYVPETNAWINRKVSPFIWAWRDRGFSFLPDQWPYTDETAPLPALKSPVIVEYEIDEGAVPEANIKKERWIARPAYGELRLDMRGRRQGCFAGELSGYHYNDEEIAAGNSSGFVDYSGITAFSPGSFLGGVEAHDQVFHLRVTARIIPPDAANP
jgi:hypothetical protein